VNAINTTLYNKLSFNLIRDIAPVASLHREPLVMLANPSLPVRTLPELIAYARANPGKLNMASAGIGTPSHLAGELIKMTTGVNLAHVPYRGAGPALVDLLGGQVQVLFATVSSSIEYVRGGKLRALAVTTATRSSALPDIPTVAEFVPSYESDFWTGIAAPKNTPAEIVDKLNDEINSALADPKMKARLAQLGANALPGSPADFGRLLAAETEKWATVVKFAGVKAD
jgi:tripartite-type tricarboxylate transporter receptor subunit TctC